MREIRFHGFEYTEPVHLSGQPLPKRHRGFTVEPVEPPPEPPPRCPLSSLTERQRQDLHVIGGVVIQGPDGLTIKLQTGETLPTPIGRTFEAGDSLDILPVWSARGSGRYVIIGRKAPERERKT